MAAGTLGSIRRDQKQFCSVYLLLAIGCWIWVVAPEWISSVWILPSWLLLAASKQQQGSAATSSSLKPLGSLPSDLPPSTWIYLWLRTFLSIGNPIEATLNSGQSMKCSPFGWALATLAGGLLAQHLGPVGHIVALLPPPERMRYCLDDHIWRAIPVIFHLSKKQTFSQVSGKSWFSARDTISSWAMQTPGDSGSPMESGAFGNSAPETLGTATLSVDLFSFLPITCLVLLYFHN